MLDALFSEEKRVKALECDHVHSDSAASLFGLRSNIAYTYATRISYRIRAVRIDDS